MFAITKTTQWGAQVFTAGGWQIKKGKFCWLIRPLEGGAIDTQPVFPKTKKKIIFYYKGNYKPALKVLRNWILKFQLYSDYKYVYLFPVPATRPDRSWVDHKRNWNHLYLLCQLLYIFFRDSLSQVSWHSYQLLGLKIKLFRIYYLT